MKKSVLLIAIAVITTFAIVGFIIAKPDLPAQETYIYSADYTAKTIIVDPGHGGIDGGSSSPSGKTESEYNLEISFRTAYLFRFLGYRTIMTRYEDISIHDPSAETVRQKKVSDIRNRIKLVNSTQNAVLISIHQNSFPLTQYYGTQVFYGKQNEKSIDLAQSIQSTVSFLAPDNKREVKTVESKLINDAECPAALVECGFLTNPGEEKLLRDSGYQKKLAMTISAGTNVWSGG